MTIVYLAAPIIAVSTFDCRGRQNQPGLKRFYSHPLILYFSRAVVVSYIFLGMFSSKNDDKRHSDVPFFSPYFPLHIKSVHMLNLMSSNSVRAMRWVILWVTATHFVVLPCCCVVVGMTCEMCKQECAIYVLFHDVSAHSILTLQSWTRGVFANRTDI